MLTVEAEAAATVAVGWLDMLEPDSPENKQSRLSSIN